MTDPSVRRERAAHTLAGELGRLGLDVQRIDAIGVTVLSVERAVSVWVDELEARWRVGPYLDQWERHPADGDLETIAERILAYVCADPVCPRCGATGCVVDGEPQCGEVDQ